MFNPAKVELYTVHRTQKLGAGFETTKALNV